MQQQQVTNKRIKPIQGHSPQRSPGKFCSNLLNISNKFAGTGGMSSSLAPKKAQAPQKVPKSGIFQALPMIEQTLFKKYYDRGDLPIAVNFSGAVRKIIIIYIFPIFFEGLRETEDPYKFLAVNGCEELLQKGETKILSVLPQLIIPIKKALATKNHDIMCITLKKIQKLVKSGQMIGEALVPYYRQILPVMNMYKNKRLNIGDKIDYSQRKNENLSDLIQETLETLEKNGGEDAYINIKYMIPTYESCMF
ncbi:unnamed protein product (macronuclear) [Paramecium tetraurelia]|uniref:Uncharacterized protein n=1 Tax=Paramecium tetraurelia TaxID=5888 RepID=A0CYD8_PARTE|nr:uncharacterized protein GSPATT00011405001 [Paramecium tetraurelia]CAK75805.1 unnamed protein product [Paramecium tetraurelia]|eukprot:XP_001443202.1 hypothetical protein (macronuclear) [Paramecium tetraurelia strain d4-2]